MKNNLKRITACFLLLFGLLLVSCSNSEDAQAFTEDFFQKVIDKKYSEATQMIDSQSNLYPRRSELVRKLEKDQDLGTLLSLRWCTKTVMVSNLSFTTVDLSVKLEYDSSPLILDVQVIDRGQGFRINKLNR